MVLTDRDYEVVFHDRDAIKRRDGLSACETDFSHRFAKQPMDAAVALNYGICLLEMGKSSEAEDVLSGLCTPGDRLIVVQRWLLMACRCYAEAVRNRNNAIAAEEVISRFYLFDSDHQDQLSDFMLTHILTTENFDIITEFVLSLNTVKPFSKWAVRRYCEISNAVNQQDKYRKIFKESKNPEIQIEMDLLSLLYERFERKSDENPNSLMNTFESNVRTKFQKIVNTLGWPREQSNVVPLNKTDDSWTALFERVVAAGYEIDPFDAYRLSLQLSERLGSTEAEKYIMRFTQLGEQYHACFWLLGALLEERSDTKRALAAYHAAVQGELQSHKLQNRDFPTVDISRVKISAIALSFNDVELVRHYCTMIVPHCDELIVNDGGSTDGTIEEFVKFSAETGFPVHIIRDRQANFRDRNIFNKDGYRSAGAGGVAGFEADRRRTTTLMVARHPYILIADLDDFFPRFPCMKTIVASSYGVESFAGSRRELIDENHYCDIYISSKSNMPTLFKRDAMHVFSGVSDPDEYLARLDEDLALRASDFMTTCVTRAYHYWHLKWIFDPRQRNNIERFLGPKSDVQGIRQKPDFAKIREIKKNSMQPSRLVVNYEE